MCSWIIQKLSSTAFLQGQKGVFSHRLLLKQENRLLGSHIIFWVARNWTVDLVYIYLFFSLFFFFYSSRIRKWHAKERSVPCFPRSVLSSLSREELAVNTAKVWFSSYYFSLLKNVISSNLCCQTQDKFGSFSAGHQKLQKDNNHSYNPYI